MQLNTLSPCGSKKTAKRVGRGAASGWGKTSARGQKGQKARSGGSIKPGFEGGQMPLHRRLPKSGFVARKSSFGMDLPLSAFNSFPADSTVTLDFLKERGLVTKHIKTLKVFLSGDCTVKLTFSGIKFTKGAKAAAEKAGCKVEE